MAVVGNSSLVTMTSSVEAAQTPLMIDHLSVTLDPADTPVTVEVDNVGVVIVALPLTMVHALVPTAGVFAAMVNADVLHSAWSGPAADTVGSSSF